MKENLELSKIGEERVDKPDPEGGRWQTHERIGASKKGQSLGARPDEGGGEGSGKKVWITFHLKKKTRGGVGRIAESGCTPGKQKKVYRDWRKKKKKPYLPQYKESASRFGYISSKTVPRVKKGGGEAGKEKLVLEEKEGNGVQGDQAQDIKAGKGVLQNKTQSSKGITPKKSE